MWPSLLAILLVRSATASSTFHPNCTLPSDVVNFVSSTNVRGTLDILWSSLFTLLICTWTIQHLNLPEQTPDCDTWQQKLKETLRRSGTKVKWVLVTLIVPEILVGRAIQDWMMAKKSQRQMNEFGKEDGVEWTLTHAYYANMGGFIFRVASTPVPNIPKHDLASDPPAQVFPTGSLNSPISATEKPMSVTLDDNIREDGDRPREQTPPLSSETIQIQAAQAAPSLKLDPKATTSSSPPSTMSPSDEHLNSVRYAYTNAEQLYALRTTSTLPHLPSVSTKQIGDKGKSDAFIKGTAMLQVLWLVIQVIVRGFKHLPVSQLEIAVIAFAACTLITYIFSWSKPQNVTVADLATNIPIPETAFMELDGKSHGISWFQNLTFQPNADIFSPIPNDADFDHLAGSEFLTFMDVGMVLAGTIFGALHLVAWNFHFPTPLESLLWKLASVYLAAVLPFYYLSAFVLERLGLLKGVFNNSGNMPKLLDIPARICVWLSILLYIVTRLCLMVLVFRSLFFLDPGTFVTTWATEIPRFQ